MQKLKDRIEKSVQWGEPSVNPTIKVSIVTFNPRIDEIKKVIDDLNVSAKHFKGQSSNSTIQLDIIDNSPTDSFYQTIQEFLTPLAKQEGIDLIQAQKAADNYGYGKSHNISMLLNPAEYHLVLNPDLFVEQDTLQKCYEIMKSKSDVGLISPAVRGSDGERHYLCKQNPTFFNMFLRAFAPSFIKKIFKKTIDAYVMKDKDYDQEIWDVPYLTGCFMFFRGDILKKINGFDERFFLYLEDADITRKVLAHAHTLYTPKVPVVHLWQKGSHTSLKLALVTIQSYFIYTFIWLFK